MSHAAARPTRLLLCHPYPDMYGADRVAVDVARSLRAEGIDVTLALPHPGPMTRWLDAESLPYTFVEYPVIRRALLRPRALGRMAAQLPRDVARLVRFLRDHEIDIASVNTLTLPHWVLAARAARLPVIVHSHESDLRTSRLLSTLLVTPLLLAQRVVAVSGAAAMFITRSFPSLRRRIDVVHNAVAGPDSIAPSGSADLGRRTIAVVGRLSPNKGQDTALRVLQQLRARGDDVRMDLIGDTFAGYDWYEAQLRASAEQPDLRGAVRFLGFRPDARDLLSSYDVLLAPSRTDSLPLVLVEAMLAGVPVVSTDVGGISEIVHHGETGLLAAAEDVDALTGHVELMLDDSVLRARLVSNARADARTRFSVASFQAGILRTVTRVSAATSHVTAVADDY